MTARRIAFVSPGWPKAAFPNGIVTYIDNLLGPLEKNGYSSQVLAWAMNSGDDSPNIVNIQDFGNGISFRRKLEKVIFSHLPPNRYDWKHKYALELLATTIKRLNQIHAIDLIEMEESFGLVGDVAKSLSIPVIARLHGPWFLNGPALGVPQDAVYEQRVKAEGIAIAQATAVSSPSYDVLFQVRKKYNIELPDAVVIPNPGPVVPVEEQWSSEHCESNLVLFVGRFDLHKGGDLVIDAFNKVAQQDRKARLIFAGPDRGAMIDGKLMDFRSYIENKISDREIACRITFLGQQSPSQISTLRKRAAITVVASRYENFPMTVVESLAYGSPTIGSATGGINEMIKHGKTGLLFKPGDANDLSEKMSSLLQDPALAKKLANAAVIDYGQRFSPAVVTKTMVDFYEDVIGKHFSNSKPVALS